MNAITIANHAIKATEAVAPFVSADVRCKLALAEVAIVIDGMDESTPAINRMIRLSEAMREVRNLLA